MRNLFLMVLFAVFSVGSYAQKEVTKFLGIPVDGTKQEMISKLKAKGFVYNSVTDLLSGEFNGAKVDVSVVTNNNKVYRIFVSDKNASSETAIKIRFNRLCEQFVNNKKYVSFQDQTLSDDENISYEINVHDKRYQAVFYQTAEQDSVLLKEYVIDVFKKFTEEGLENITEEKHAEILEQVLAYWKENIWSKRSVWFMISSYLGEYRISMYYDNGYNQANGEDL